MNRGYSNSYRLYGRRGNNIFSYDFRGENPYITIPSLKIGTLEDIEIGEEIVFEEMENGILRSCQGLKNFIQFRMKDFYTPRVTIFDNHNHALYFWYEALLYSDITEGIELIHIDEHSDLWENENTIHSRERNAIWEFTNFSCNVGNYIKPAQKDNLIKNLIRIENEYQIDMYMHYIPSKNSVLNIDLDFFSPRLSFIEEDKKISCIRNFIPYVQCITIATSPFFIDQQLAISKLKKIFEIYF